MGRRILVVAMAIAGLVACRAPEPTAVAQRKASASFEAPAPAALDADPVPAPRRLVRRGTVTIEVDSVPEAVRSVEASAGAHGGFVEETSETATSADRGARVVLRVPSPSFDAAFDAVRVLGRVTSAHTETVNVGAEYADLGLRLGARRQSEARLRELLAHRAADLSDVLAVERELDRRIEEIERLEGRLATLDREVALSTIEVNLRQPADAWTVVAVEDAWRSARRTLATSLGFLVYLVAVLVPWLAAATGAWVVTGRFRRRRS